MPFGKPKAGLTAMNAAEVTRAKSIQAVHSILRSLQRGLPADMSPEAQTQIEDAYQAAHRMLEELLQSNDNDVELHKYA